MSKSNDVMEAHSLNRKHFNGPDNPVTMLIFFPNNEEPVVTVTELIPW